MRLLFISLIHVRSGARRQREFRSPHFEALRDGIAREAARRDFQLTDLSDPDEFLKMAKTGSFREFHGLIGAVPDLAEWSGPWRSIEREWPCVNVGTRPIEDAANFAGVDESRAMELLLDHLMAEGFHRCGFVSLYNQSYTLDRFRSVWRGVKSRSLSLDPVWTPAFDLKTGEWTAAGRKLSSRSNRSVRWETEANKLFDRLEQKGKPPEVVLFETDKLAALFYEWAGKKKWRIPEDVAITGFDDLPIAMKPYGYNILTTIRQDLGEIGRSAVLLLDEIIRRKRPGANQKIWCEPMLIPRHTARKKTLFSRSLQDLDFQATCRLFMREHSGERDAGKGLAKLMCLEYPYFLVKFKRIFEESFVDALNGVRLERMAFLLRNTELSVTRIQVETGFATHQNMNALFQKKYGMTARQYRKQKTA